MQWVESSIPLLRYVACWIAFYRKEGSVEKSSLSTTKDVLQTIEQSHPEHKQIPHLQLSSKHAFNCPLSNHITRQNDKKKEKVNLVNKVLVLLSNERNKQPCYKYGKSKCKLFHQSSEKWFSYFMYFSTCFNAALFTVKWLELTFAIQNNKRGVGK